MTLKRSLWSSFPAATALISLFIPTLFFAYILEAQPRVMFILSVFFLEALFLAITFDLEKNGLLRVAALVAISCTSILYVSGIPTDHPFRGVEARIFYMGVEAVRQNQSPYSGPATSELNLGFVPIYALCSALGDTYQQFQRSLLTLDLVCAITSAFIVTISLYHFFRRNRLSARHDLEIVLEALALSPLFYLFFMWNRSLGNFSILLTLLVLLVMVSHYFNRPLIAGLILGTAISVKPYFGALLIGYAMSAALKKDKQPLVVIAGTIFVGVATALVLGFWEGGLGFETYVEFFSAVSNRNIPGMLSNVSNISAWAALSVILTNSGINPSPQLATLFSGLVSVLAYGGGLFLCIRNRAARMPMDHVAYYLLLTTAIYPLLWDHYFSWLLGPALYLVCKLNTEPGKLWLLPPLLFSCFLLLFSPIAWVGALTLPIVSWLSVQGVGASIQQE